MFKAAMPRLLRYTIGVRTRTSNQTLFEQMRQHTNDRVTMDGTLIAIPTSAVKQHYDY